MDKVFQIFKAGSHTDMHGKTLAFSRSDLADIAAAYPKSGMAPLCLGHPRDNRPAYGFIKKVMAVKDALYAVADVSDGLISAVKEGRYKKLSAAFNFPSTAFPTWTLRHVGFLGAHPPAVRGMEPLSFSGHQADEEVAFAAACSLGDCLDGIHFAVPDGFSVDHEAMKTYVLIEKFRNACPGLDIVEAASLLRGL